MSIVRTVALRRLSVAALLFALSLVGMARDGAGQGLGYAILARYFDALRQQVGIPGMSAAVVQSGQVVWEAGFGQSQVGQGTPATPSTPYPILGLSQTVAATIVLDCAKPGLLELDDPIRRWSFELPEVDAEVREILSHTSNGALNGAFQFDPARFAVLNPVLEWCLDQPYALGLASQVFDRLGMSDSVPSHDLGQPASAVRGLFPPARLTSYLETLGRVASPYQTQGRGIVEAGQYLPASLDATGGIVSSVRDLARFDVAFGNQVFATPSLLDLAWRRVTSANGIAQPFGLGWFVQDRNGRRVVWHFGSAPGAYSALMVKVPDLDVTLIMLANSDGLAEPFQLANGDVSRSIFAELFLRFLE